MNDLHCSLLLPGIIDYHKPDYQVQDEHDVLNCFDFTAHDLNVLVRSLSAAFREKASQTQKFGAW